MSHSKCFLVLLTCQQPESAGLLVSSLHESIVRQTAPQLVQSAVVMWPEVCKKVNNAKGYEAAQA